MSENKIPYKIYLNENEIPKKWYNLRADMKNKPAPMLNPGTLQPMTAEELAGVFCEELVAQELDNEHAQIPIIAMTANAFEDDMEKARGAGMNAYIAKPVDPEAVKKILEQVLANRTKNGT